MASILFAYTALESFANEEVPDDFIYIPKKRKPQKEYNKEKIERFISLGEKLSDVLPSALSLSSPTGTDAWDDFLALEKLRHSVIHMKMAERQHLIDTTDSVWSNLL